MGQLVLADDSPAGVTIIIVWFVDALLGVGKTKK